MIFNKDKQTWVGIAFEVEEVEYDFALKQFVIYDFNGEMARGFFGTITPEDLDDQEELRNGLALNHCTIEDDEGNSITLF